MGNFFSKIYLCDDSSNEIIYSLWMGRDLSSLEQLSIKSYLYHGHKIILYVYDDIKNIPDGVDVREASEILGIENLDHYSLYHYKGSEDEQYVKLRTYSLYSDLFRYELLSQKGGWWSDLDVVCLKPYDFDAPYVFCRAGSGSSWICGSVLKSPKDSLFMKKCIDQVMMFCKDGDYVDKTGPFLLNELVAFYNLQMFEVHWKTFFPIWWLNTECFFKDIELPTESYGVHLCHTEIIKEYDLTENYDSSCLYEKWKRKYL